MLGDIRFKIRNNLRNMSDNDRYEYSEWAKTRKWLTQEDLEKDRNKFDDTEIYIQLSKLFTELEVMQFDMELLRNKKENSNDEKIQSLISIIKKKNQNIETLNTKLNDSYSEIKSLKEQLLEKSNQEEEFKSFLIKELFDGKESLKDRSLEFVMELYTETKNLQPKTEIQETEEEDDSDDNEEFDEESYLKSWECVCGKNKKQYFSKGCPSCRKEADKIRKRLRIPMDEAWRKVWSSYGKDLDFPTQEN